MASVPGAASSRPAQAWRHKAQRFWRWWSGELLALVPGRFAALAGSGRIPLVEIEDGAVRLIEPRPEAPGSDRAQISGLEAPRAAAAVRALLERAGESRGRVRLALLPHEALVRRVTMPSATEENLGTVLGFEMDRLTPFPADEVHYDYRVVGRDSAAGTIAVLLAVARREVVEARMDEARALGLSVQGVAVREDVARAGPLLDVLPSAERGEREQPRERVLRQGLAVLALLLLLAVLVVPALRKRAEVHAIKPALDKAHAEAKAADALIQELERLAADHNFLLARRHATYPALAYIEEISRLMPDNTWLMQMDLKAAGKGREVLISGETASSSRLIEILEQSKLLQNAMPRGAVTRGNQPGTERFVIAAEVRPRTPPEAVPVTQAQAPVALAPAFAPPQAPPEVATVTPTPSAAAATRPSGTPPAGTQPSGAPPSGAPQPGGAESAAPPNLIFRPGGRPPSPVPVPPPKAPPK